MSRRVRLSILIVASFAALALTVAATSTAKPRAQAAKSCFFRGRNYRYSYLTGLYVRNTSCDTGRYVAHKHGNARGWTCHQSVTAKSKFQYDANEYCKSGRRQVTWSFTQNT
jgi:hypothetical protein